MSTIVLNTTTKTIKAVMSGAPATTNPDFVVSYADNTGSAFTEGENDGTLNGTSEVTLVSAPASSTRRIIKSISIYNRDTAAVTVTIKYDNNGTQRILANVTLAVGDTWTFDGTFDSTGSQKQTLANNAVLRIGDTMTGTLTINASGTGLNVTSNILAGNISVSSNIAVGNISLTGNIVSLNVTNNVAANTVSDNFGNLRGIPISGSEKSSSYTLAANDVGRLVIATTSGSITVPNTTIGGGNVISVYNNTSGNIVMTLSTSAAYVSGNNTNRTSLNLATRGIATVLYISSNSCVVTGSVS